MLKRAQGSAWGQGLRSGRGQTPASVDTNRGGMVDKSCLFGVFWGSKGGLDSGVSGVIYCTRKGSARPPYFRLMTPDRSIQGDHIAEASRIVRDPWRLFCVQGAIIRAWTMHPFQGAQCA